MMNKHGQAWYCGALTLAVAGWLTTGPVAEAQSLRPGATNGQKSDTGSSGSSKNTSRPAITPTAPNPVNGILYGPGSFYPGMGGQSPSTSGNAPQSPMKLPGPGNSSPFSGA